MTGEPNQRGLVLALWGATGATGRELLRHCLQDERIGEVRAFVRRPLSLDHPRLTEVRVSDFLDLSHLHLELSGIDVAYWCLGVSQPAVPDETTYRKITHDYTLAAAQTLLRQSPDAEFHFVSGMGADREGRSRVMWARIKGQTEADLLALGLRRLVIWRPGYIRVTGGRRNPSAAERLATMLSPLLRLLPNMTNTTVHIARAMLAEARKQEPEATFSARDINVMARHARETHRAPSPLEPSRNP
jgi:uncharacterized protein YbjT (DUF2867 family)